MTITLLSRLHAERSVDTQGLAYLFISIALASYIMNVLMELWVQVLWLE